MNEKTKALNSARMGILHKIDKAFIPLNEFEHEFEEDRMEMGLEWAISQHFEKAVSCRIIRQHWSEIRQHWHQCTEAIIATGQQQSDEDVTSFGNFLKDKITEIEEDAKRRALELINLTGAQKLREEIRIKALLVLVGDHGVLNIADLCNYTRNVVFA